MDCKQAPFRNIFARNSFHKRGWTSVEKRMGPKLYIQSWGKSFTGVSVLIKANVQHTIHTTVMDQYAPNQDDPHFFQHLINEIECIIPNDNRIIGGDFNLVLDIEKDKCGRKTDTHKRSNEMIKAWIEETELVDIWRHQNPERLLLFTWRGKRPNLVFSRIDFFLISVGFVSMSESKITPGYHTDHSSIELGLQITSNKKGKGFWKLNTSLMRNIDYLANVKAATMKQTHTHYGRSLNYKSEGFQYVFQLN